MGLSICRRIITKSGGSISVISKGENKGSTFVFCMQMKLVDMNIERIPKQEFNQVE